MPCESCNVQFTIFKHKKSCSECRRLFCLNCLEKTRKRSLCSRCVIFCKRPLTRNELQRLKAKDLIVYLQSKHIPTAGCVEKDDLVNLVLAHVDSMTHGQSPSSNSSSSIPSPGSHYDNLRSYFNNLTSPQATPASPHSPHPPQPPQQPSSSAGPRRQSSRDSNSHSSTFFGSTSGENPFSVFRQGCQVILDNVTDKIATNFKFDPTATAGSSSRSSNSASSSATSPSPSTRPQQSANRNPRQSPATPDWENAQSHRSARSGERVSSPMATHSGATENNSSNNSNGRQRKRQKKQNVDPGCECSDDEESKQQRTTSQSTSNLLADHDLAIPGTSGTRTSRPMPLSRSKGSTLSGSSEFSSFEEINVVTVEKKRPAGKQSAVPASSTTDDNSTTTTTNLGAGGTGGREGRSGGAEAVFPSRVISRRRSEGCLAGSSGGDLPRDLSRTEQQQENQNNCCSRCGRKKNELNRRLKRFHDQLMALSTQDEEVRQHLEAILLYLERKRVSVVSNGESNGEEEEDSISEPVIVSQPMPRVQVPVTPPAPAPPPLPRGGGETPQSSPGGSGNVIYKRRFVQLDDIRSSADLEEFSVKQLKEILVLNRVDFKGCCEKKELIERVRRLLDDYNSCPAVDKLPVDDLCKICMDAPIECVILECGHMATCVDCGKVLSECPICRQFIIRVVRFFRA